MKHKYILIGSILIFLLLILVSCSSVVGYQTIKTRQEKIIKSKNKNLQMVNYEPLYNLFTKLNNKINQEKLEELIENIDLTLKNTNLPSKPMFVFGILIELIAIIWGTFFFLFLVFIVGINPHG